MWLLLPMMILLLVSQAPVEGPRTRQVRDLPVTVEEVTGVAVLRVDVSALRGVDPRYVTRMGLELDLQALPGDEIQLWVAPAEGLPWEQEDATPIDVWPVDERTGPFVRFDMKRLSRRFSTLRATDARVFVRRVNRENEPEPCAQVEGYQARLVYHKR